MRDGPASARQRKSWQLRGASSPHAPVVLDGRSARGLLALLEGLEGDDAQGAREQLAGALERGNADAIRAAMDRARLVVPQGATVTVCVEPPDEAA